MSPIAPTIFGLATGGNLLLVFIFKKYDGKLP